MLTFLSFLTLKNINQKNDKIMNTTDRRKKTFGQQERYANVTKVIFSEKLKCKTNTWLRNIDITMEEPRIVKLVRRIVEKRMCQAYHRLHKDDYRENSNRSRHNMKRAISYELHVLGQVEDIKDYSRGNSTHWKKKYDPNTGQMVFKKKLGFHTVEEARIHAMKLAEDKPWIDKAVCVYKCAHCGMYHIGHESRYSTDSLLKIAPVASA